MRSRMLKKNFLIFLHSLKVFFFVKAKAKLLKINVGLPCTLRKQFSIDNCFRGEILQFVSRIIWLENLRLKNFYIYTQIWLSALTKLHHGHKNKQKLTRTICFHSGLNPPPPHYIICCSEMLPDCILV